ncbi:MAG: DUF523 domain-containing protein [Clostridia bacterium]|nr:DUF523 domain-containing protein [Clostridia bacterium]
MRIVVSACLLGENCKYNGKNNFDPLLCEALNEHEVLPVCPEVLGGLSVPRCPCEIVGGAVMNKNGENVDSQFRSGAAKAVKIALENGAQLAVLQPRSPSCGVGEIYDGSFSGTKIKGDGIFARALAAAGIKAVTPKEFLDI